MVASRPEPEWDAAQRAWMQALVTVENSECPRCHTDMADTTGDHNETAWEATDPIRCHRCTVVQRKSDDYHDAKSGVPQPNALLFGARRRDRG